MSLFFGNLTTKEMIERLGVYLTDEEIKTLEEKRQNNAQVIRKGKFHCFEDPFLILAGDYDTAMFIVDILKPHEKNMQKPMTIAIEEE